MTQEQYDKFGKKLLDKMNPIQAFHYEGRFFRGYPPEVLKDFAKNVPNGDEDFYVWLQKNYAELKHL